MAKKKAKQKKQKGMSLPGAAKRRANPKPNVYTGLAALACIGLVAACVVVAQAGISVGPGSGVMAAIKLHPEGRLDLGR
ncbi:MAG: hypothetical protein AAGI30_01970 [Planctomycetota bacterium]